MAGSIGKLVGGALGLLAGGPVGALVGVLIGHQYDASGDAAGSAGGEGSVARVQALFLPATFRLMGHVAKSDGRVSEQEIDAARGMMRTLRLNSAQVRLAIDSFTQGKQPDFPVAQQLRDLRAALAPFPQLAQFFIELQLQAALAGNGLAPQPRERVRFAAQQLGLSGAHFHQLESLLRWRQNAQARSAGGGPGFGAGGWNPRSEATAAQEQRERLAAAYSLLEARAGDSDEQVVKAYRRQMSRHHPDKLQANGLPEAMLERAKERTQQIQQAYEYLRAARGMS